jgi:hypothetical protein
MCSGKPLSEGSAWTEPKLDSHLSQLGESTQPELRRRIDGARIDSTVDFNFSELSRLTSELSSSQYGLAREFDDSIPGAVQCRHFPPRSFGQKRRLVEGAART